MWKLLELRKNHLHVHFKFTYIFDNKVLKYGENLQRSQKELYFNIHITLLVTWTSRRRLRVRDFTLRFSFLSQQSPRPSCDAHIHTREGIHTCVCFHSTFPHSHTYYTNVLYIQQIVSKFWVKFRKSFSPLGIYKIMVQTVILDCAIRFRYQACVYV